MSKKFDPYAALGVGRDATDEEIRAAAKAAAKESHPDAGGTAEAFNDTRRALVLLTNRKRRAQFDRTGEAEESEPDNAEAAARAIISRKLGEVIDAYLMSDFNPAKDPRKIAVVDKIRSGIEAELQQNHTVRGAGVRHIQLLEDLMARFDRKKEATGFDIIKRLLDDQVRHIRATMIEIEELASHLEKAIEMLAGYEFRKDEMPYGDQVQPAFFRS